MLDEKYLPLIGEFVWHSLTADPTLLDESERHYEQVREALRKWPASPEPHRILEVCSYAHVTGYMLHRDLSAEVTLFDLSAATLRLGRKVAAEHGFKQDLELVAGDFHQLPFADNYFDTVYIFSSLHHTHEFERVARELQRVLAPGGLLLIMNEPYMREACFYKFATNRLGNFIPFEKKLEECGIINTVAEPHLGSRDENLFGIIENQKMPLGTILDVFSEKCHLLEVRTDYETKVGDMEQQWLLWAGRPDLSQEALTERIRDDLGERIERAAAAYDAVAEGLGFQLPGGQEIDAMSKHLAAQLKKAPPEKSSWQYRRAMSELFGGSVFLAARKEQGCMGRNSRMYHDLDLPLVDGVRLGFTAEIAKFLSGDGGSIVPVVHLDNRGGLHEFFPEKEWSVQLEENGFYTISLRSDQGRLLLPSLGKRYLLLLRMNFLYNPELGPFCLEIRQGEQLIFSYTVYQPEAILLREIIAGTGKETISFQVQVRLLTEGRAAGQTFPRLINIYYAGAFPL